MKRILAAAGCDRSVLRPVRRLREDGRAGEFAKLFVHIQQQFEPQLQQLQQ